jgi:hypothetical protein
LVATNRHSRQAASGKVITLFAYVLSCLVCSFSSVLCAEELDSISFQDRALAPNAGGQTAYSLKLAYGSMEYGAFANEYLRAGDYPLSGITVDYRLALCEKDCWGNFYAQAGVGGSTGGPLASLTWSLQIPLVPIWLPMAAPKYLPQLRVDFTTHFIFVQYRAVTWSYPLWLGITIPL